MKYVLLMYFGDEKRMGSLQGDEQAKMHQAWQQFYGELHGAGKLLGNDGLSPTSSATTIRKADGRTILSDGPFAETKEQLGGYFAIEAANLDEAVEWAGKMPHLAYGGSVEIRPVWQQRA